MPARRAGIFYSAFPEGKVDFLQLVAEKTEEGFPATRRTAPFAEMRVPFYHRIRHTSPLQPSLMIRLMVS